jgi:hypothetical protein
MGYAVTTGTQVVEHGQLSDHWSLNGQNYMPLPGPSP